MNLYFLLLYRTKKGKKKQNSGTTDNMWYSLWTHDLESHRVLSVVFVHCLHRKLLTHTKRCLHGARWINNRDRIKGRILMFAVKTVKHLKLNMNSESELSKKKKLTGLDWDWKMPSCFWGRWHVSNIYSSRCHFGSLDHLGTFTFSPGVAGVI